MKLVDGWHRAYRWFSVQIASLGAILAAAWTGLPDDLKSRIPHWAVSATAISVFIGIIGSRLINQQKPGP